MAQPLTPLHPPERIRTTKGPTWVHPALDSARPEQLCSSCRCMAKCAAYRSLAEFEHAGAMRVLVVRCPDFKPLRKSTD